MRDWYILNSDGTYRKGESNWSEDWIIARDTVGDAVVSTVFLGLDHQFGDGPPLVFETMIFGGEHDQEQWRYSTIEEAREGHDRAVQIVSGDWIGEQG